MAPAAGPAGKTVVAVYKFRDQTGQYRLQENGASFSTVVTQGATSILLRALEESRWFESIEHENIGNLLNERKIIRSAQSEFAAQTGKQPLPLASMLFASIILEGGIISYDSNIITGGGGLRYFGAVAARFRDFNLALMHAVEACRHGCLPQKSFGPPRSADWFWPGR